MVREQQTQSALDEVIDVTDRPGLPTVPGHGERLARQGLADEGGDGPPVVGTHAGAEGVEDPQHSGVHVVEAPVGHGQRLREALSLVVHASRADRVHVTPVRLGLRVHLRVAVALGRGRQQVAGALLLGEPEAVQGADGSDLHRLDRQTQVVDRRGRRGEVQDVTHRAGDVDVVRHVRPDDSECLPLQKVLHIRGRARDEVVQAQHLKPLVEQPLDQVRTEETCASRNHRAFAHHAAFPPPFPLARL